MNNRIDELLQDLADDIRRQYPSLPSESTEYKIWTQNLSRNPPSSTPLLPGKAKIGRPEKVRRAYRVLCNADEDYQRLFIVMYVKRFGKKLKAKALGIPVSSMYQKRKELVAYVEGAMMHTKSLDPIDLPAA